jgi:hypothetical protein
MNVECKIQYCVLCLRCATFALQDSSWCRKVLNMHEGGQWVDRGGTVGGQRVDSGKVSRGSFFPDVVLGAEGCHTPRSNVLDSVFHHNLY